MRLVTSARPAGLSKEDPRWAYLPVPLRDWWSKSRTGSVRMEAELFNGQLSLTRKMHSAGVLFMAGTDGPNPYSSAFALHDELKLLVNAGFLPWRRCKLPPESRTLSRQGEGSRND
jgi:hypothetical protein